MELLKCHLCNSKSNKLNALSCEHKTCNDCLYKICLFNKDVLEAFYYDKDTQLDLNCLKCASGTLQITKQVLVQKFNETKEKIKKEEHSLCSLHNEELNTYCLQCRIQMCSECFLSHKSLPMFATHECSNQIRNKNSFSNTCCLYNKPFNSLCIDCNCAMCDICNISHSKKHKIVFLEDFNKNTEKEFLDKFVLPALSEIEIYKRLESTDIKLKEKIRKEATSFKGKLNSITNYLNETSAQLDKEVEIICEEIDANNSINRTLYGNLIRDLDTLSTSEEFNLSCQYLMKIPKYNDLLKRDIKLDNIIKIIDEMSHTIETNNSKNKSILQIETHLIKALPVVKLVQKDKKYTFMQTLDCNKGPVSSIIQLLDGRIASCSFDRQINIWDPEDNFKNTETLTGHTDRVYSIIQLQDGRIASGSADNSIKIWDILNNNFVCTLTIDGHTDNVECLLELHDGRIASASFDKTIKIWDPIMDSFECIETLTGHTGGVIFLIQLQDGRIASGSADNDIKIWDPENNFKCTNTLTGHDDYVLCGIQLFDGRIASVSRDGTMRLWDTSDGFKCTIAPSIHENTMYCLTQLRDGRIATGSDDVSIKISNTQPFLECVDTLTGHGRAIIRLLELRGGELVSASADETIKIWN